MSHRSCAHSLQPRDNSNISILILHLHDFLTICLVCLFLLLVVKEFKAVSGHNKYMGSLEGVTAIEKEKFPKNFWPDVSVCVVAVFFLFLFTSESHVSHTAVLNTLLGFILLILVLLKCTMYSICCINLETQRNTGSRTKMFLCTILENYSITKIQLFSIPKKHCYSYVVLKTI